MNLDDQQIQGLQDVIKRGNDAKAVRNLKQFKETVLPAIEAEINGMIAAVGLQAGTQWAVDPASGQNVKVSYTPVDVNMVQQTMWIVTGMKKVTDLIEVMVQAGELAKQQLKSGTAEASEGGMYGG